MFFSFKKLYHVRQLKQIQTKSTWKTIQKMISRWMSQSGTRILTKIFRIKFWSNWYLLIKDIKNIGIPPTTKAKVILYYCLDCKYQPNFCNDQGFQQALKIPRKWCKICSFLLPKKLSKRQSNVTFTRVDWTEFWQIVYSLSKVHYAWSVRDCFFLPCFSVLNW